MPWTSSDLANIDAAIASGTRRVRQGDKDREYASMEELKSARMEILNYLAQLSGPQQVRQVRIFTDSGY